jgi:hypothetical protein
VHARSGDGALLRRHDLHGQQHQRRHRQLPPSAATSSNSWTETTCPTLTNTIPFVAPGTCTDAVAGPGNGWTSTSCSDTVSAPAPYFGTCFADYVMGFYAFKCTSNVTSDVPVMTCTPSGPLLSNGYTTTTCVDNDSALAPRRVVHADREGQRQQLHGHDLPSADDDQCRRADLRSRFGPDVGKQLHDPHLQPERQPGRARRLVRSSGPDVGQRIYDHLLRQQRHEQLAVDSCTPSGPTGANSWTTTTCPAETLVSGPTIVGSCTPVPATGANNHQRTDCNTVVVSTPGPVRNVRPGSRQFCQWMGGGHLHVKDGKRSRGHVHAPDAVGRVTTGSRSCAGPTTS